MSEAILSYIKRVKELAEHVRGNEQATKQSLIGPLFTILGYDLTDPRECVPEHREDFGRDRSVKPIDWAFFQNGRSIFVVEAKEAGKRLAGYDEQLGDYYAKQPETKLGILTNGVYWKFFTDVVHANVMDREPFLKWDVVNDEEPPFDFLTLLHKSQYSPQLIRTFAERKRNQNLLVSELNRLLEPSTEFVRLAVANIETRKLMDSVVESWKPVLANAIEEWAKQRMLSLVLSTPPRSDAAPGTEPAAAKVVTTPAELEGFAMVQKLLGVDRPVAFEDTVSYFKIHLVERKTWVICRLYFDRKKPCLWVPLSLEQTQELAPSFQVIIPQLGWSCVILGQHSDLEALGDLLKATWDQQRSLRPSSAAEGSAPMAAGTNELEGSEGIVDAQPVDPGLNS